MKVVLLYVTDEGTFFNGRGKVRVEVLVTPLLASVVSRDTVKKQRNKTSV